ncbi:MAG: hypothetical protein IT260_08830 [Saprospiraceae bacterium]|nr:hypothetical protein [Saprospiraceae bacterium]
MILQLEYSEKPVYPVAAALIPGASAHDWLVEIDRWGLSFRQWEGYILPESQQSVRPAALLVVFNNRDLARSLDLKNPYAVVAERLFIPLYTRLTPEIQPDEWSRLLNWHVQVLHPQIGLVGFQQRERLDPLLLLAEAQATAADWSRAQAGLAPRPPLQRIEVLPPTPEQLLNTLKDDLDTKPLQDIPKEEEDRPTALQQLLDQAKKGLYKNSLSALNKVNNALPEPEQYLASGWMKSLHDWLTRNLEELEKRRHNELERLLQLFDKNSDEALKYAIPLDNAYANRGTAPPGWELSARDTNFNLKQLGGGQASDAWEVGNFYYDLQAKYHAAAHEAIARSDFRRAAYIYAHLLGNFHLAANVLKQGSHFREAAVLYKEHLNSPQAAAECLESGGFLSEAAELYETLARHEKAGDLYQQAGQPEQALAQYQKSLDAALQGRDFLDAARLAKDKLREPERAQAILLDGWQHNTKAEACLKQYFRQVLDREPEQARQRLLELYEKHTTYYKRPSFLQVLVRLRDRMGQAELLATARQLAYEIASETAQKGNLTPLSALRVFQPSDRLLAGDCSRFVHQQQQGRAKTGAPAPIQLDPAVQWLSAIAYRNQFLIAGVQQSRLRLARANAYGEVEYYSWDQPVYGNPKPVFVFNPYEGTEIFLRLAERQVLEPLLLPRNRHFDTSLRVGSPSWLPREDLGIAIERNNRIAVLTDTNGKLSLQFYTHEGVLLESAICTGEVLGELSAPGGGRFPGLFARNGVYFSFDKNMVLRIEAKGALEPMDAGGWRIRQLCVSEPFQSFRLVALTDNGFMYFHPDSQTEMNSSDLVAKPFTPVFGAFLPGGYFLAGTHDALQVFQLTETGPVYVRSIAGLDVRQIAVLPAPERGRCVVVSERGSIRFFDL